MKETQATIVQWADKTFGEAKTIECLFAKVAQEWEELCEAMEAGNDDNAVVECADVFITLCRLADYLDADLMYEVDKKMAINRARKWDVRDGVGQHIEEEP